MSLHVRKFLLQSSVHSCKPDEGCYLSNPNFVPTDTGLTLTGVGLTEMIEHLPSSEGPSPDDPHFWADYETCGSDDPHVCPCGHTRPACDKIYLNNKSAVVPNASQCFQRKTPPATLTKQFTKRVVNAAGEFCKPFSSLPPQ